MTARRWDHGEVIVRREVLALSPLEDDPVARGWRDAGPWLGVPVFVVEDTDEHLVTYLATGAELGFNAGAWPTHDGRHPWNVRAAWEGHGTLMVQRPGEHHAIWHFWKGPDRRFECWYVNLQTAFVRTAIGYDTQDLELDLVVPPDASWALKDRDVLDQRVDEGRFAPALRDWIVSVGDAMAAELDAGRHWWDDRWASWAPPATWTDPRLPDGWATA
jgi:hypothetical protein